MSTDQAPKKTSFGSGSRLFISYKRTEHEHAVAFAVRQWLIDSQGWSGDDIFVDLDNLHAGMDWEEALLAHAEAAQAMLYLASDASVEENSFCRREVGHAKGTIITVTLGGLSPADPRLANILTYKAKALQIAPLDQQPTEPFKFIALNTNKTGSADLNPRQLQSIATTLRNIGVAPNAFTWTPSPASPYPYPGLRPLQEGDEALFCGRDLEIRDGLDALAEFRTRVTERVFIIQAPSGAGKSSFLRAGLWTRLRRHAAFTPLAIVRTPRGVLANATWGLASGLAQQAANALNLAPYDIAARVADDLPGLLADIADADDPDGGRRTLLLGIDQAEEITGLNAEDAAELDRLLGVIRVADALAGGTKDGDTTQKRLDIRLVLTARDDSLDALLDRLAALGFGKGAVRSFRLNRLPVSSFREIIAGPAAAANRPDPSTKKAIWPVVISP